ncbi:MAG TPA: phosphotransferase [Herpetosiphonaceae bacterium]
MKDQEMIVPGVTHAGLAALLERHGLGALESVAYDEQTTSLLVNQTLVVRCQPDAARRSLLLKEALIYRRLHRGTDVPCPRVLALDTQRDLVDCDVLVLEQIRGVIGSTVWPHLDSVQREQISEELGRICGSLHLLPWSVYGDLSTDEHGVRSAYWIDIVMQKTCRAYERAARLDLLPPRVLDAFVTTINDSDSILCAADQPVLTHTDLGLWNVVLRQDGARWHVAAIVGWDAAITADPVWEFAPLWSAPIANYPLPDAFMYGYRERRPPPHDLRIRRRIYRIIHHLEQALELRGQANADAELINVYLTAVGQLLTPH